MALLQSSHDRARELKMRELTFLLVHGSWLSGEWWQPIVNCLSAAGVEAVAPTLTGLGHRRKEASAETGLAVYTDDIVREIDRLNGEVVLVGHSYGGAIVTEAAHLRSDRIAAVVILDGYLVVAGQSLNTTYPQLPEITREFVMPEAPGFMRPAPLGMLGLEGVESARALCETLSPMPLRSNEEPARFDASAVRGPRFYMRFTEFPLYESTAVLAREQGWRVAELQAPHMAVFTHSGAVAVYLAGIAGELRHLP
jgi:pimeloyl-ACP methyl ester carboxylesterase